MPARSYTTIWSSFLIPSASAADANASAAGSMCGKPDWTSAIFSTSKNLLPGMRSWQNSWRGLRPAKVWASADWSAVALHPCPLPPFLMQRSSSPAFGKYHEASSNCSLSSPSLQCRVHPILCRVEWMEKVINSRCPRAKSVIGLCSACYEASRARLESVVQRAKLRPCSSRQSLWV